MTRREFDERGATCPKCGSTCRYVPPEDRQNARPEISAERKRQIWKENDDVCACCNLHIDELRRLGMNITVQHTPAYHEVGHNARLLPFCEDCQAYATSRMMRMRSILKRFNEPPIRPSRAFEKIEVLEPPKPASPKPAKTREEDEIDAMLDSPLFGKGNDAA